MGVSPEVILLSLEARVSHGLTLSLERIQFIWAASPRNFTWKEQNRCPVRFHLYGSFGVQCTSSSAFETLPAGATLVVPLAHLGPWILLETWT